MKYARPFTIRWLLIIMTLAAALGACSAKTPVATDQPIGEQIQISRIVTHDADGKTELTIEGTAPIAQYTSFQLADPPRLVVDISNASIGQFTDKINVNSGSILDITPSQKESIARLEIALTQTVDTKAYQADGNLVIEVARPETVGSEMMTAPVATAPAAQNVESKQEATEAAPQQELAAAKVVKSVQASAGKKGVTVVISGDGAMEPKFFLFKGKRLVIDVPGASSRVKPSVIPVRKGGLLRVRVGQHRAPDKKVRIVLDLSRPMEYTVTPEGSTIVVAMQVTAVNPEKQERPERMPSSQVGKKTVKPEKALSRRTMKPSEQSQPETGSLEKSKLEGGTKFKGRRISLDLQDADLINVMRLFAEVANLNVILAPNVRGKVTVRMVNIPWDQAMDIILRMNGLGYMLEDNVLRIASVAELTREAEQESKAKEAKKKSEDLITRIIPINYSTAAGIEGTVKKSLSPRGDIVTDARTNTLIVKDIARNVEDVVSLIKLLDKPIPQIMIEARIVEASLTFSRQLGVQWGGTGSMDAAHGNPTGLSFPNSIGVTGGPTMGAVPSGQGNFLVNMPAAAGAGTGGGAVGFTFGSLSRAMNLDLVLSALESTGEGKIISSPRVSALDNKEARIEQGLSIPFSTTSASGTQIQFIDAKLALTVTPHATPDNKIFLKIQATKNAPDTSILGASGQPSIRKNEATTEILLSDGETAVIGGILTTNRTVSYAKIPFLGDLPFIGWLFKSKTSSENKGELLIFITPRIVRQEVI